MEIRAEYFLPYGVAQFKIWTPDCQKIIYSFVFRLYDRNFGGPNHGIRIFYSTITTKDHWFYRSDRSYCIFRFSVSGMTNRTMLYKISSSHNLYFYYSFETIRNCNLKAFCFICFCFFLSFTEIITNSNFSVCLAVKHLKMSIECQIFICWKL